MPALTALGTHLPQSSNDDDDDDDDDDDVKDDSDDGTPLNKETLDENQSSF